MRSSQGPAFAAALPSTVLRRAGLMAASDRTQPMSRYCFARGIGLQPQTTATGDAWSWSSEPFVNGLLGKFTGKVALKFARVAMCWASSRARELNATYCASARMNWRWRTLPGLSLGRAFVRRNSHSAAAEQLDHTRPDFARACGRCDVVVHGRAATDHRFARLDG